MSKRLIFLALLGSALFAAQASAQTTWTYHGLIDNCNVGICSLVPIEDGFPVVGRITINAGPNASFTLGTAGDGSGPTLDLIDFDFLVGGVIPVQAPVCPEGGTCDPVTGLPDASGVIISGSGTTDANGNFSSGVITGTFVGGTLGGLLGGVSIDLVAGTMVVTVGGGSVHVADVLADPGFAIAPEWTYNGVLANCNTAICSLVPIVDGDPVTGSLKIDAGPNASFNLATAGDGSGGQLDLIDFEFLVGGVIPVLPVVCPDFVGDPPVPGVCDPVTGLPDGSGVILTGSGTTDANGDFASGTVTGTFVGATLGPLLGAVNIDLVAGTMTVTVGGGAVFVADVVPTPGFVLVGGTPDTDGDGVADDTDNCTDVANADQYDSNGDDIGSLCDPDITNDCSVNFLDLNAIKAAFFSTPASPSWNPDADFDNSGSVNFSDLNIMKAYFFGQPGPSAAGCN